MDNGFLTQCRVELRKGNVQVFDVLELQARRALLPDAVISAILGQLTVNITYERVRQFPSI
ncbi:hypothetical protein KIN20_025506 [Parelaphostrongylus tenuis]|uniref:Uncharacterized protein n=1 Tax=Parelaphostrongylus tenuis TaxID=148309 RepID=A0AAD5QWZ7_PARTN|nr:hypothetical protein KIN20_025506 [Parelaphostrongylus tenuis]